MTTLCSSFNTLRGNSGMKCSAPVTGPRAGCFLVPAKAARRHSLGSLGGSKTCYRIISGAIKVQERAYGERILQAHFSSSRNSLQKRSWRCFVDIEKTESESAAEPPNPSCCTDSAERRDSVSGAAVKEEAVTSGDGGQVFETYGPGKRGNQLFGLASVTVAVGLFLSGRFAGGGPGLPELAATAISYQEALSNGRPTVVEFYADWCEVCKETAHDVYEVEQEYKDQVNFVMLNVDNSKWEDELDEFGVEGIPHFAFLDREGNEEGNIVGRLPRKILKENLAALARGDATVPHSRIVGQFSNADSKQAPPAVGPLSHGQM